MNRADGEPSPLHFVADHVEQNESEWRAYFDLEAPEESSFPGDFADQLSPFETLCLLRCAWAESASIA